MKKVLITLSLLMITAAISFGQTDMKAELKKDLVTLSDNKYQIGEFAIITFSNDATLQFETTASAATDVISRDQFVSIYSSFGTILLVSILEEAGVKFTEVSIESLDELIGKADISIHMEMTKNGMQIAITTENGTERQTMTWKEYFGDDQ